MFIFNLMKYSKYIIEIIFSNQFSIKMNMPISPRNHRDSISSNQDSLRSSSAFQRQSKSHLDSKKISVDRRVFNKLMNFLKLVVKDVRVGMNEFAMIEQYVQTEEVIINEQKHEETLNSDVIEKILHSDEETIAQLKGDLEKVKNQCEEYLKENVRLKQSKEQLEKELEASNRLITDYNKEKEHLQEEIHRLKAEIEIIKIEQYNVSSNLNNIYSEASNGMEDAKDTVNGGNLSKEENSSMFMQIVNDDKVLHSVLDFLPPKDFFSLLTSNKSIQSTLKKNSLDITNYKKAIEIKNRENMKNKFYDWCKEYEINDQEMERLLREYVQLNRLAGSELKNMLIKSLTYIDNEIKPPLGYSGMYTEDNSEKKKNSLFGSLNSYFSKIIKKKEDSSNKRKSVMAVMGNNQNGNIVENINDYDKFLLTDNLLNSELNVDFEFSNSDEIKGLLVQFFTNLKNSPQTISNFISELITEYSDFIFYAYRALIEIKELDIVKNAMHERFKKYHKITLELEGEIEDLKKFSKTNREIKEILLKQKQEVEVKYTDLQTQITHYKDELNKTTNKLMTITEKYNRIENEYETFKSKLVKEFKILKNEYDNVFNDRGILLEAILEFKKYFMRFHITEEGEIAYVETD